MTNFAFLNTPDWRDIYGAAARAERGLFHRYRGIRYTPLYTYLISGDPYP